MLRRLTVENYALIERLDMELDPHLNIITGETGAGKSILLGALGLLLGNKNESGSLGDATRNCVIEGLFDVAGYGLEELFERNDMDYEEQTVIRRMISPSGKSRAFVNDVPVQLSALRELGAHLIDIHSQHQNLLLNKENFQLKVIDILARDKEELQRYKECYSTYKTAEKTLRQAQQEAEKAREEEDYLAFQLEQLDNAALKSGEQEELEKEQELLSHAEEIKQVLYQTGQMLDNDRNGILDALKEARHLLEGLAKAYPDGNELAARMESCYIELKDLAGEISGRAEQTEFNPERLDYVTERLNTIYDLEQKHRVDTVDKLLSIADDCRRKLDSIAHSDAHLQALQAERDKTREAMCAQAARLTALRRKSAAQTEIQMRERLIPMGIPNVQFKVELAPKEEPDETGADKINFLFSANRNGQLQPIAQVASGGEIARVMLSLKAMISGAVKLPTIIFDEIDTGVSGSIAEKMARIMQEMGARNRQVISITHLPQIAALGTTHYKVYKEDRPEGTASHIVRLDGQGRVEEIAHMLSGATLTEAAIDNAKALLNPQHK